MDRKNQTFAKEVANTLRELENLKTTQFSGSDNLKLHILATTEEYDHAVTLSSDERWEIYTFFNFSDHLKKWQPTAYTQIYYQIYIDSPTKAYRGIEKDGVIITTPRNLQAFDDEQIAFQIYNDDSADHTIYAKFFVVTTAQGGMLQVNGYPVNS